MAVSGLPEPCRCHARCIARLALDMMDLAADEVQIDGEPVVSTPILYLRFVDLQFYFLKKSRTKVYANLGHVLRFPFKNFISVVGKRG